MKEDLIDIIYELNEEIMESVCSETQRELKYAPLGYSTDGEAEVVEFYGYPLWANNKKTDTYELTNSSLRRKINKFIKHISKIELLES